MDNPSAKTAFKVSIDKRILNEFASKILNEEKMGNVMNERERSKHSANFSEMLFHCECDDQACTEMIATSAEEYEKVHHKTKQFIVKPGHTQSDLEEVTERFGNYVLVEKFFPHTKQDS